MFFSALRRFKSCFGERDLGNSTIADMLGSFWVSSSQSHCYGIGGFVFLIKIGGQLRRYSNKNSIRKFHNFLIFHLPLKKIYIFAWRKIF